MIKLKTSRNWKMKKQYWFTVTGGNGETLVTSEMYTSKQMRKHGILTLINVLNNPFTYDESGD